jgi:hypothetical protein
MTTAENSAMCALGSWTAEQIGDVVVDAWGTPLRTVLHYGMRKIGHAHPHEAALAACERLARIMVPAIPPGPGSDELTPEDEALIESAWAAALQVVLPGN